MSAVPPCRSVSRLTSAPCSISSFMTSLWPETAAASIGVTPGVDGGGPPAFVSLSGSRSCSFSLPL
jgi:hypothetical protein